MAQITLTRIKRIQFLLFMVVVLLLIFGGCGRTEETEGAGQTTAYVEPENMVVFMSGGVDAEAIGTSEWKGLDVEVPAVVLSDREVTVTYEGQDFMKSCAAIGGDSIFLTGYHGVYSDKAPDSEDYFFGRLGAEEAAIREFDFDAPQDMFALRGSVDKEGNWHLLLSQRIDNRMTYEKTEIWVIDSQGQREEVIDLTEMMKQENFIPFWLAVDEQGSYYLSADMKRVLQLDSSGQLKNRFETDSVRGLGIGRSGQVYGVFENENGEEYLGSLNPETGYVERLADFPERGLQSSFDVLQPGAKWELLLANRGNGAWRYDGESLELKVSTGDILGNGQDIAAMGFLEDGRICVMSHENDTNVFYYVPVEL